MKKCLILSACEFKKLFVSKAIIVIFAVFFCLNIFNIVKNFYFENNTEMEIGRYELYEVYKGELDSEKYDELSSAAAIAEELIINGNYSTEYQPDKYYSGYAYGEAMLRTELFGEATRLLGYEEYCNSISAEAAEKLDNEELSDYYLNVNAEIAEIYNNRSLTYLSNSNGLYQLLSYRLSDLLVIMLAVIAVVTIFTAESENGTVMLVKPSKNGGRMSTCAKIIASVFCSVIICFMFFATDIILFSLIFRIDAFFQPVYIIGEMKNTPFTFSVLGYLAFILLGKISGVICVAGVTSMVSVIFKRAVLSIGAGVGAVVVFMCLKSFATTGVGEIINLFNPLSLILLYETTSGYDTVNLFSVPVPEYFLAFACGILVAVISVAVTIAKGGRNVKG